MSGPCLRLQAARAFDAEGALLLKTLLSLCAGRLLVPHAEEIPALLCRVTKTFSATFLVDRLPGIKADAEFARLLEAIYQTPAQSLTPIMAELYEQLIDSARASRHGIFYTPSALARRMIREAFAAADSPRTIADISSGSGVFLLEALREMKARADSPPPLASLFGVDRDPQALECSRMLLQLDVLSQGIPLEMSRSLVSRNIRAGNSLIDSNSPASRGEKSSAAEDAFSFRESFPEIFSQAGGFDLIVGNPPYGLSRDSRINREETVQLKRIYRNRVGGRINTYLLFILRAFDLLSARGTLSLVVPNAWLGIDEAQMVREFLLESGALCSVDYFNQSPFKSLGVEVVTFMAHKGRGTDSIRLRTFDSILSEAPVTDTSILRREICADPSRRIPLRTSAAERQLLSRIERNSMPLKGPESSLSASIALQAYARGRGTPPQDADAVRNHPFHLNHCSGPECIPYLNGQDVSRLQINWSGEYLRFGPWLAEHHPRARYTEPRILVREVLAPAPRLIQAVYTDQPYSYNRSILHIHATGAHSGDMLKALAVLLNSTVASFWLQQRGRKAQRTLFPKVLARDLNEFPLPADFRHSYRNLAELHDRICTADRVEAMLPEIDQEAARLFRLSSRDCLFLAGLSVSGEQRNRRAKQHNSSRHHTAQEISLLEEDAAANN